jgi:hypothetical protein
MPKGGVIYNCQFIILSYIKKDTLLKKILQSRWSYNNIIHIT